MSRMLGKRCTFEFVGNLGTCEPLENALICASSGNLVRLRLWEP